MGFGVRQSFGRYVAIDSRLHALDSLAKVVVFGVLLASIFVASTWLAVAAVAAYVIALCFASRVGARFFLESLKYFAWMFALSFAINVAFPRGQEAQAFSPGAIQLAAMFAAKLVLMILAAGTFTVVTCPSEIGDVAMLGSRVKGRVGRGAAEFGALMSISLRFVPVMFEEAERIRAAQTLRGGRERGLAGRIRAVAGVIVPLVESSLRRAANLGFALEARCYGYRLPVARGLRIGRSEAGFLAAAGVLLSLTILLR